MLDLPAQALPGQKDPATLESVPKEAALVAPTRAGTVLPPCTCHCHCLYFHSLNLVFNLVVLQKVSRRVQNLDKGHEELLGSPSFSSEGHKFRLA